MTGEATLDRLAALYGIEPAYTDSWGERRTVSDDTKRALLAAMAVEAGDAAAAARSLEAALAARRARLLPPIVVLGTDEPPAVPLGGARDRDGRLAWRLTLESGESHEGAARLSDLPETTEGGRRLALPGPLPLGYHRLAVSAAGGAEAACGVAVAPARCIDPADKLARGRGWGLAVQLYGLVSERNRGLGDFGDLAPLAEGAARHGAAALGLNPLHALFAADPNHFGPYGPSSRAFLNVLYIDPAAAEAEEDVPEARALVDSPEFREALAAARAAPLVDYPAVSRLKLPVLEAVYGAFRARHLVPAADARGRAFESWRQARPGLAEHAVFEALHAHFWGADPHRWHWRTWPADYQDHRSAAVREFAARHAARVDFHAWLQWVAERQLAAAQQSARAAGMGLGLYCDLAVAAHPGGSDAWRQPGALLQGAGVGAPSDAFNPFGQTWGLAAPAPAGLRDDGYAPILAALRATMRHAGVIRIDHVMGLRRLYCVPEGASARDGAYLAYPFADLARLVALESQRNDCAVVGEDLGTLPEGFREALREAGILSYRLLWFEREADGRFTPPNRYPREALVAASTHDLPTIRGYCRGHDLDWRRRLGLFDDAEEAAEAERARADDRRALLALLREQGLLDGDEEAPSDERLVAAVHRLLARAPSTLMMVQAEDLAGEIEQANLPGTVDQHPNWRRRLPRPLEALLADPGLADLAEALRTEGRGG